MLSGHNSVQSGRSHHCLTFSANSSRILLACKRNLKSWDSNTRHRFCQSIQLPFSTASSAILKLIIHLGCCLRCSKNPVEEKVVKREVFEANFSPLVPSLPWSILQGWQQRPFLLQAEDEMVLSQDIDIAPCQRSLF